MEENKPGEQDQNTAPQPEHSPRSWRSCCLAPALALGMILLIGAAAYLFSPAHRGVTGGPSSDPVVQARRDAFVEFGKQYFAMADRADNANQAAFNALQAMTQPTGSIDAVHTAFQTASDANAQAASGFRTLNIPSNLVSQDKLQHSLDVVAQSYDKRREACDLMVVWNGDVNDKATSDKYNALAGDINRLTQDGMNSLGEAARDNQLTEDDVKKFLPATSGQSSLMSAPGGVLKMRSVRDWPAWSRRAGPRR